MNPIEKISQSKLSLTKSEEKIKTVILNTPKVIVINNIIGAAKAIGVSKSVLLRFCQKVGYDGYSEFKYNLAKHLISGSSAEKNNQEPLEIYLGAFQKIPNTLTADVVNNLYNLISQANKIKIYGFHETGLTATYLSCKLAALGIDSEVIDNTNLIYEKANMSKKNDLNIYLSLSGVTEHIVNAFEITLKTGSKNIIFTQNDKFKYLHKCDGTLILPTFNLDQKAQFLDSQVIVQLTINLLITNFANIQK
ncbi:MAG: MurR/RpiR family transcriptional regulator [Erysipelotrichaceae bacterium]